MNTRQLFPAVNTLPASQPDLHRELQRLIDQRLLTPLFQPIFALDSPRILGYEALIRGPETSPLHKPEQLFAVARSARHLASLEYACREAACRQFMSLGLPGRLFLNMSPLSFTDNNYRDGVTREILQRIGLNAERLVFELTENQPLDSSYCALRLITLSGRVLRWRWMTWAPGMQGCGYGVNCAPIM